MAPDRHPEDPVETIARRLDTPVTVLGVVLVLLLVAGSSMHDDAQLRPCWARPAGRCGLCSSPSSSPAWWPRPRLAGSSAGTGGRRSSSPFPSSGSCASPAASLASAPPGSGAWPPPPPGGVRTAWRTLSSRLAWLGAVMGIVVLAAGQLLFEFGGYESYGRALHDAAHDHR